MTENRITASSRRFIARHVIREFVVTTIVWVAAAMVLVTVAWILFDVAARGFAHVTPSFLIEDVQNAGREGGIGPIFLATGLILLVCMTVAIPLSLGTAIALTEQVGRENFFSRNVRRSLDVLAGVPSIVFGLFGNAFFTITLGLGYSILSGGLTLACMVLPILIRTSEQAIMAVPSDYRYAAAALGLRRTSILFRVVLPSAAPAIVAGVVLSIGRALAETAALIFTSGYVARTPRSLLDSGRSMSVHIYDLAMNVPGGGSRAYATACALVLMLLLINVATGWLLRVAGLSDRPKSIGFR
ncbi:phosphate ABC transporter permease PstA [Neorhodopirellula pilleata]|uniref:Phosphate transport system permease protein PstA n=1 Tax=Neorhodopirellula pilleata TaxID=2714738 RepID=A0A5C6A2Q7_9BACT|nr:phosphate ABC transporter permease PstA [Neorhodopirellula pilleata]TWT93538.1 Phosphate transport system permease protein PstA [Neorhodopirellula pilleata]